MSTTGPGIVRAALRHELEAVRGRWVWYLLLGIALVLLGLFALTRPFIATASVVVMLGWLLLIGGVLQVVAAFWTRDWSGFFLSLLMGVLFVVAGLFTLKNPVKAAAALTLLIGSLLMIEGIFKIVAAAAHRFAQWGWVLLSGVVSAVLGFLIWSEFQEWTPVLLGTLLGVDLLFNGFMWIGFSLAMRKLGTRLRDRLGPASSPA